MLKGVVDVAPIAMLKVAQDQAGSFDFLMTTSVVSEFIDGDYNPYSIDAFKYTNNQTDTNQTADLFSQFIDTDADYTNVVGFNLINFRKLSEKLDPLNDGDAIKGFSPRWILPSKLRNITNTDRNTSCIMIIVDSRREVDLGLIEPFSQEIIGDSEVMISETARKFLDVSAHRKDKVEIVFDFG